MDCLMAEVARLTAELEKELIRYQELSHDYHALKRDFIASRAEVARITAENRMLNNASAVLEYDGKPVAFWHTMAHAMQRERDAARAEAARYREALVKIHKWAQYTMHEDIHEITNYALCPKDALEGKP